MSLWAKQEERIRQGCERFLQACRRNGFDGEVDARLAKEWAQGMRDWVEAIGENWDIMDEAVDEMRKQDPPLIIASPRSCIKVARDLKQWRPRFDTEAGRRSFASSVKRDAEDDSEKRRRYAETLKEFQE